MHSGHDQKRMNVEDDRLSNLPDDLIHKILSYISTKEAVGTSVLASRWRFMWTSLACLSFSSEDFSTLPKFSKFVTHVLSGRNDQIEVSSVKLSFRGKVTQAFVKRLMNYAFSHNVQQMTVECLEKKIEFPLSVFKSQSLKSLSLIGLGGYRQTITSIPTWELSALTILHLDRISFCDDNLDNFVGLFSKFINLKSLTLKHYNLMGFSISHPKLCTLTLEYGDEVVNVVAPQLKNLSLTLLHNFPNFPNGLPSLEKMDICIDHPRKADTQEYVRLLQLVHSVKSLTLNLEVIEVLSSSVELFLNQPFTFDNLKILRIYPFDIYLVQQAQMKEKVSAVVKNYFLDSSPSATMTMASREEIRAARHTALVQKCMPKVQVMLDELKDQLNKKVTPMGVHKTKMNGQGNMNFEKQGAQSVTKRSPHIVGKMKKIQNSWEDLSVQLNAEKSNASRVFSELRYIGGLFTDVLASKRGELQACFASLCEEADTVMNKIVDRMKIQCELKRRRLNGYFRDLVKASQSS
uniref:F-box/FBD/LRR-repeat protein At3g26920-like n=1 Tax=Erigeron canadensis TaxID=72917 RepID=UPI001CB9273D|nr:F-box/FBD/LRR-repeat protein At3g26920-like [Erigeron canadensis]XP_043607274.1 F-box/FBD/LRR-repeat protein At3g26920-like [Erigeron canadensis]